MAHLSDGTLRRMFDDPDALAGSDRRHYVDCARCQARYTGMADDARAVATLLVAPELTLDVASALKRVGAAPAAKPRFGFRLPIVVDAHNDYVDAIRYALDGYIQHRGGLAQWAKLAG